MQESLVKTPTLNLYPAWLRDTLQLAYSVAVQLSSISWKGTKEQQQKKKNSYWMKYWSFLQVQSIPNFPETIKPKMPFCSLALHYWSSAIEQVGKKRSPGQLWSGFVQGFLPSSPFPLLIHREQKFVMKEKLQTQNVLHCISMAA